MKEEQDRTVREKNCNITPFVQLSPRLDDQTSRSNRAKVLRRSQTTVRETNVQLDSHQRRGQGYCKYYRFDGDRIGHDVPSYDRNRIGSEDKRRKDVPVRINGSGGRCMTDSPLDSGREDDIESTQLVDQQERVEGRRGEGALEWGRTVHACHQGGGCVGLCPEGREKLRCQDRLSRHRNR